MPDFSMTRYLANFAADPLSSLTVDSPYPNSFRMSFEDDSKVFDLVGIEGAYLYAESILTRKPAILLRSEILTFAASWFIYKIGTYWRALHGYPPIKIPYQSAYLEGGLQVVDADGSWRSFVDSKGKRWPLQIFDDGVGDYWQCVQFSHVISVSPADLAQSYLDPGAGKFARYL